MENIIGKRFGKLIVKEFVGYKKKRPFYYVVCDCGNEKEVCYYELIRGQTRSCGCLHRKILGLNYYKIRSRINSYHWTVEEAFEK